MAFQPADVCLGLPPHCFAGSGLLETVKFLFDRGIRQGQDIWLGEIELFIRRLEVPFSFERSCS